MTPVRIAGGRIELESPGSAFVDADWVHSGKNGRVSALAGDDDGLRWNDGPPFPLPKGVGAEEAASRVIAEAAREVVALVDGINADRVAVMGDGFSARLAREVLGSPAPEARGKVPPAAIIEMLGTAEAIRAAAEDVEDLGLVVLAGVRKEELIPLELYSDIHLRGLRVVGASLPLSRGIPDGTSSPRGRTSAVRVLSGEPLPSAGEWFLIESR